jgi:GNAT superfamily N-acetyltransferase
LLCDFNREFGEPSPAPVVLATRLGQLLAHGDTAVRVVGDGPEGLAVLRFRPALWTSGLECYLAELYVIPSRRGQGLGRALMEAALREAKERGAHTIDIAVDEPDLAARRPYESLGFPDRASAVATVPSCTSTSETSEPSGQRPPDTGHPVCPRTRKARQRC